MGLLNEFKKFAMRGNVVDMAVGIVIGAAFGKIVSSLVGDVIMPLVGKLTGGGTLTNRFLWLGDGDKPATLAAALETGQPLIGWGSFLQTVIDFTIIAFAIFMVIKAMNSMKKKEEAKPEEPPKPSAEVALLTEIRDQLKNQNRV
jgi:large conductance mechanosensitive channel